MADKLIRTWNLSDRVIRVFWVPDTNSYAVCDSTIQNDPVDQGAKTEAEAIAIAQKYIGELKVKTYTVELDNGSIQVIAAENMAQVASQVAPAKIVSGFVSQEADEPRVLELTFKNIKYTSTVRDYLAQRAGIEVEQINAVTGPHFLYRAKGSGADFKPAREFCHYLADRIAQNEGYDAVDLIMGVDA